MRMCAIYGIDMFVSITLCIILFSEGSRKELKVGAIPVFNLPPKKFLSVQAERPEPKLRIAEAITRYKDLNQYFKYSETLEKGEIWRKRCVQIA